MITPTPSRPRPSPGRGARSQLIAAAAVGMACLALGCGDDDSAQQAGLGGSVNLPDASTRDLPGDGLEPTPATDITVRQRNPIGPQRLNDALDRIRNGELDAGLLADVPDSSSAAPAPTDAGAG